MYIAKFLPPYVTHGMNFTRLPLFFLCTSLKHREEPGDEASTIIPCWRQEILLCNLCKLTSEKNVKHYDKMSHVAALVCTSWLTIQFACQETCHNMCKFCSLKKT